MDPSEGRPVRVAFQEAPHGTRREPQSVRVAVSVTDASVGADICRIPGETEGRDEALMAECAGC